MRLLRLGGGLFALTALAAMGALCDCSGSSGAGTGDGGGDDGSMGNDGLSPGDGGGDGGCDATKTPAQDACVISDAYGIFVAPTGSDTGQGTMASPFKTIGHAIGTAKTTGKRVYVCATMYDELVVLDAGSDGVSLFGALACPAGDAGAGGGDAAADAAADSSGAAAAWSYTGMRAVVAPTSTGFALKLDRLTSATVVEDMEFDSAPGAQPGESSVAVFADGSADVTLRRVRAVAGDGAAGKDGTDATGTPARTTDGASAQGQMGGASVSCNCPNGGTTTGGMGGNGSLSNTAGGDGSASPAINGKAPLDGKGGAAGAACNNGGQGDDGAPATAAAGGAGAAVLGTLDENGWKPADGAAGANGDPGEGGGGGGGMMTAINGGAGGGACGGCGGVGGQAGGGGGGSIALASVASGIKLDACVLVAGNGKNGGKGGAGQAGGAGGGAGAGVGGCSGGAGGQGGAAGGGGGGAGGVSVVIAYTKTAPMQANGTKLMPGMLGQGGQGGAGAGQNGSNGMNGVAAMTHSF